MLVCACVCMCVRGAEGKKGGSACVARVLRACIYALCMYAAVVGVGARGGGGGGGRGGGGGGEEEE